MGIGCDLGVVQDHKLRVNGDVSAVPLTITDRGGERAVGHINPFFGIEENIAAVSLFRAGFHCRVIRTECVTDPESDISRIPFSQAFG